MDLTLSATLLPFAATSVTPAGNAAAPGAGAFVAMLGQAVSAGASAGPAGQSGAVVPRQPVSAPAPAAAAGTETGIVQGEAPAILPFSGLGVAAGSGDLTLRGSEVPPAPTLRQAAAVEAANVAGPVNRIGLAPVLPAACALESTAVTPLDTSVSAQELSASSELMSGGATEPSKLTETDEERPEEGTGAEVLPADFPQPVLKPGSPDRTLGNIGASGQAPAHRTAELPPAQRSGTAREPQLQATFPADTPLKGAPQTPEQIAAGTSGEATRESSHLPALPIQGERRSEFPTATAPLADGQGQIVGSMPVSQSSTQVEAHGVAHDAAQRSEPRHALDHAFGERLGMTIARRVREGADEMLIRMDPVELGRIHVRLSFDEGGSLRAVVAAESPQVLDTLRRDTPDLQRTLSDAGVRTDAQSFRFDRGSGSNDGGQGAGQWSQRAQRGWAGDAGTDASEPAETYRPLRRNSRLDLMA